MFLDEDYLLFMISFFFFFFNETKVGVCSQQSAPTERPGAQGELRRPQKPGWRDPGVRWGDPPEVA